MRGCVHSVTNNDYIRIPKKSLLLARSVFMNTVPQLSINCESIEAPIFFIFYVSMIHRRHVFFL